MRTKLVAVGSGLPPLFESPSPTNSAGWIIVELCARDMGRWTEVTVGGQRDIDVAPVTLVVTVLDIATDLPVLLNSISGQSLLPSELLIVDRGSIDGTLELLCGWQPPDGVVFRIIEAPEVPAPQARNFAIETATCEYIAVTDGAVRLRLDWLALLWAALSGGADVAPGRVEPFGRTWLQRAIGWAEIPDPGPISARFLPSSRSIAFRKSTWDMVGGYPEWLEAAQDRVFAITLRQSSARFQFVPDAVVIWNSRQELPGYIAHCYQAARAEGAAGVFDPALVARLSAGVGGLLLSGHLLRSRRLQVLAVFGFSAHFWPYLSRTRLVRSDDPGSWGWRFAATVGVVLIGDAAKIAGYPVGLFSGWRRGPD